MGWSWLVVVCGDWWWEVTGGGDWWRGVVGVGGWWVLNTSLVLASVQQYKWTNHTTLTF